jgi:uncharacterized repeat protein (TIGR03803 family)
VADSDGNLYGSTIGGGANSNGVVFKLTLKKKTLISRRSAPLAAS